MLLSICLFGCRMLLIVLNGIEKYERARMAQQFELLIVLNGIEKVVQALS